MHSFQALEELLAYDFTQMRGLGNRATDEALVFFHKHFRAFFDQFGRKVPSIPELNLYLEFLNKMTDRINDAEEAYHFRKFLTDNDQNSAEDARLMASFTRLESFVKIPVRMQFWAAGANFADTIRYAKEHKKTIAHLNAWSKLAEQLQKMQEKDEKKSNSECKSPSM
jgi:hypothetical protein